MISISIDLPSVDDNLDAFVYLLGQEVNLHDAGYTFQKRKAYPFFVILLIN